MEGCCFVEQANFGRQIGLEGGRNDANIFRLVLWVPDFLRV